MSKSIRSLVTAMACWLATGAAFAAEPGEAGESVGMPQLDVSTYPSQIFWLVVFFALLYYLLTRKGLPRLTDILEARQDRIAADLDRAAKLREEAERTLQQYEAMLRDAQDRAQTALREAQERLTAEYARRQAELDRELQAKIAEAEKRIAETAARALEGVRGAAAEVVQAAVEKLAALRIGVEEAREVVARIAGERGP